MSEKARIVGINQVALEVGDIDEALEREGIEILPGRGLDFLDPWGNRVQVVQYDEIQFANSGAALRILGVGGLDKTAKAQSEMRERGLL